MEYVCHGNMTNRQYTENVVFFVSKKIASNLWAYRLHDRLKNMPRHSQYF
jgi:hypothetical protein